MKLILLGTGTSTGIPEVGCSCMLCRSQNPKDKRLRTSALLVSDSGTRILIDCGPDFRQQANHIGLDRIDAIVLTHEHYDHVYGLDDLRTIAWFKEIPIYGQPHVLEAIRRRMHYVFSDNPYPGTPKLKLIPLQETQIFEIKDITILPLLVMHGKLPILAYRFHQEGTKANQDISYITDMKTISTQELSKVDGSDVLIINALRYRKEHPSHQSVEDVLRLLECLQHKPKQTILTHLSHHAPSHSELTEKLSPKGVIPGYDYACITIEDKGIVIEPFQPALPLAYNSLQSQEQGELSPSITIVKVEDEAVLDITITYYKSQLKEVKENFNVEIDVALSKLAQFQRMTNVEMQACIFNAHISNTSEIIEQKFSLSVNQNNLSTHSIQAYSEQKDRLDITVVQHLLSAFIYKELKALLADVYQGALHPKNY